MKSSLRTSRIFREEKSYETVAKKEFQNNFRLHHSNIMMESCSAIVRYSIVETSSRDCDTIGSWALPSITADVVDVKTVHDTVTHSLVPRLHTDGSHHRYGKSLDAYEAGDETKSRTEH